MEQLDITCNLVFEEGEVEGEKFVKIKKNHLVEGFEWGFGTNDSISLGKFFYDK